MVDVRDSARRVADALEHMVHKEKAGLVEGHLPDCIGCADERERLAAEKQAKLDAIAETAAVAQRQRDEEAKVLRERDEAEQRAAAAPVVESGIAPAWGYKAEPVPVVPRYEQGDLSNTDWKK